MRIALTDALFVLLVSAVLIFEAFEYVSFGDDMRCNVFNPCQSQ